MSDYLKQIDNRVQKWKLKLLDLSLRNPLLSLRINSGVSIWYPNSWELAQKLIDNDDLSFILAACPISDKGGIKNALQYLQLKNEDGFNNKSKKISKNLPSLDTILKNNITSQTHSSSGRKRLFKEDVSSEELDLLYRSAFDKTDKNNLWFGENLTPSDFKPSINLQNSSKSKENKSKNNLSFLIADNSSNSSLQADLARIFRTTRQNEEEIGIHTLFLSIGLVRWGEEKNKKVAPLILIPVGISRKKASEPFVLSSQDGDVVLNPALEEVLSSQFGVNWSNVKDVLASSRIDFTYLKSVLKETLEGKAQVLDDVRLTNLNYAKYRMWKDLEERQDEIKDNPIIRQIIDPNFKVQPSQFSNIEWEKIDKVLNPSDLFLPLPADASQVKAIARVDAGENLVIQGPPGTGKSQTITNMIANLLGKGKRVLFVAEKLTALEVVHNRLNEIGLGDFCLELHNKINTKTTLLPQLEKSLSIRQNPPSNNFEDLSNKLSNIRNHLNESLEATHRVYPNNLSMYKSIGLLAIQKDVPDVKGLFFPDILKEDHAKLSSRKDVLGKYIKAFKAKNEQSKLFDVWTGLDFSDDNLWKDLYKLESLLSSIELSLSKWPVLRKEISDDFSIRDLRVWFDLAKIWLSGNTPDNKIPLTFKKEAYFKDLEKIVYEYKLANENYANIWNEFRLYFNDTIFKVDKNTWNEWLEIQSSLPVIRWFKSKSWSKRMQIHTKQFTPDEIWTKWALNYDDIMQARREIEKTAKTLREECPQDLIWDKNKVKIGQIISWLEQSNTWALLLKELISNNNQIQSICMEALNNEEELFPHLWLSQEEPTSTVKEIESFWNDISSIINKLSNFLSPFEPCKSAFANTSSWEEVCIQDIKDVVFYLNRNQSNWHSWFAVERRRSQAIQEGLFPLIKQIEDKTIDPDMAVKALEKSYLTTFVNAVRMSNPEWVEYQGSSRLQAIDKFQDLVQKVEDEARKKVISNLALNMHKVPLDAYPDMKILKRELQKKRRHLSARNLIRSLPNLIPILKPCLMMSPLSVSEYLSSSVPDFDVVIFDEASQITTADAIGVITRAKQVVIVGDPKQMPPSNLFSSSQDDEEFEDQPTAQDLESILSECLACAMPSMMLNWHYRSRHEKLIAFSNKQYYNDELTTFPSPDRNGNDEKADRGLIIHQIDGIYDRGKTQTNYDEAVAIVKRICEHLEGDQIHRSIGVVTFNKRQQNLIEEMFDKVLASRSDLEDRLNLLPQPLTIKNLESVQGDERDIILFSTTFGKNAKGNFTLNFGPLGQLGGERRLNVAITRARDRIEIFTSFSPFDIDPQRVTHQGVKDLRSWLLFARSEQEGDSSPLVSSSVAIPDSPFELAVIEGLKMRGWEVVPQVGCSGYRIDIGVVNPHNPERFLAAIECDGAMYHSLKTARDRDKQRQLILESLGWNVIRIWSTDWFQNLSGELQRVDEQLQILADKYKNIIV